MKRNIQDHVREKKDKLSKSDMQEWYGIDYCHTLGLHRESSMKERAEWNKQAQGLHECEVATAKESNLHQHLEGCTKNPGHTAFIPVNEFKIDHLPKMFHDSVLWQFTRVMINLTVRVCVWHISDRRPQTFPDRDEPYPFSSCSGWDYLRTGTGTVLVTDNYTEENKRKWNKERKRCPCEHCKHSPRPMKEWCEIFILTAQHVVFDNAEARYTTCQLFYDSDEELDKIQHLKGEIMWSHENIDLDMCWLICYTHDLKLAKRLKEMVKLYQKLYAEIYHTTVYSEIEHPIAIIVSHPHGCSKQVTIGEWTDRQVLGNYQCVRGDDLTQTTVHDIVRYRYTTPTFPGSSGAPVIGLWKPLSYSLYPHSQRCEEEGYNMSGAFMYKTVSRPLPELPDTE